ncbi:ABC transporter permease [Virgibacillus doumboii]|uniref:ABC transporter permease n=1 Tax=Virgibacillus doumboii TaxID=2697503 RepID=UPI0013E0E0A1|nr:ABC transporter permease [Virgibacillus doumboii]
MHFIKHLLLFTQNNIRQLKRKWLSLPLIILFPIILAALCAIIAVSILMPDEQDPIQIGLVDKDKSKETKMVVDLIESSSQLGSYIQINKLTNKQAERQIDNQLSAFVTFPEGFTENLYNGNSVTLHITGNPNKRTESFVIKELLDSIARHIRTAQANILTINYYAKQLDIDKEERTDMLFNQFTNFVFYTVGKDKIIDEEEVTNNATGSTVHYYGLAAWFIITSVWLLAFYSFFTKDEELRMKHRMRLYGVTQIRQILAKILSAFAVSLICTSITFIAYIKAMDISLYMEDYIRTATIISLYGITFLMGLAVLETIFSGQKIRLLMQSLFTFIVILLSGALIPTLYFPLYVQNILPYSFSSIGFHWLKEIILNGRVYADYLPMVLLMTAGTFVFIGLSMWKERVSQ